ncbi:metal ABC transporter ATP-binding protein [Aliamphritea ceti]|uniref:metal ABC transporter ATP-binding protein n=1 Tax=Aliamphritea ceti TaxID=1524258 RepID=UPI0021C3BF52|nr:ABC transporter ATP-binding protein [Aliamphritea ceti]
MSRAKLTPLQTGRKKNALQVTDLSIHYQQKPVLSDTSFVIPEGKSVAIIGPNGAGKSTLLKGMLNLIPKTSGKVSFFGDQLKNKRLAVAYVPQREEIDWDFPINVFDVVLMGRYGKLSLFSRPRAEDKAIAMQALQQVGMQEFSQRQISELSGGQQQRVFLARALAQHASIYLLDEPFAGVDIATEKAIIALFRELQTAGKTVICVHHDLNTVPDYFDWALMINARLVAAGPTAEVFTPENLDKTYNGRLSLLTEVTERLHKAG